MTKRRSIVWLSICVLLIVFLTLFSFYPKTLKIGLNDFTSPVTLISSGLDLSGGDYVTFEVDKGDKTTSEFDSLLREMTETMKDRLVARGYKEAQVTLLKPNRIKAEIPNLSEGDKDGVLSLIGARAVLEIRLTDKDGDIAFDAQDIKSAQAFYDNESGSYGVQISLNKQGQEDIAASTENFTSDNTGTLVFLMDGVSIASPTVQAQITGEYNRITGLQLNDAVNLAIQITHGAYELSFADNVEEFMKVGAAFGDNAGNTVALTVAVALALIFIFMIVRYGLMGVAAVLSFLAYLVLLVTALAFLPYAQLTVSGLAGVILGMALTVCSSVLIFERVREKFASGKSRDLSIQLGFKESLAAVLDTNIMIFLGAVMLYILAPAAIVSFAVTLMFGIVISMFTTFAVLRIFLKLFRPLTQNDKLYALKKSSVKEVG